MEPKFRAKAACIGVSKKNQRCAPLPLREISIEQGISRALQAERTVWTSLLQFSSSKSMARKEQASSVRSGYTLKNGSKGTDVKAMQEFLLQLEYSLPKYGADGEFGSETEKALKKFQKKVGIKQDGIYGSETHTALMDAVADDDDGKEQPETEKPEVQTPATKQVRIVCASGSVNIRVGNDTKYSRITSVKDGATFEWIATAENGWHAIVVNAQVGWVSGKYSQVV